MMPTHFREAYLAAVVLLSPGTASAQSASDYPAKPVRVLLGFAPGGATDILVRLMAQKLTENMGRSFVVESLALLPARSMIRRRERTGHDNRG